jgi:hypothetical protein
MNRNFALLLLLALAKAKREADAQAKPETETTPCDCAGCTFNRAIDNLMEARTAFNAAEAELHKAKQVAYDAEGKKADAQSALIKAQAAFDAAADAINAERVQP